MRALAGAGQGRAGRAAQPVPCPQVKVEQTALELRLTPLTVLLRSVLDQLQDKDPARIFAQPVSLKEVGVARPARGGRSAARGRLPGGAWGVPAGPRVFGVYGSRSLRGWGRGAGSSVQSRAREARVPLREKPSRTAPPAGRVRRSGRRVQFKELEAEGPRQVVG